VQQLKQSAELCRRPQNVGNLPRLGVKKKR